MTESDRAEVPGYVAGVDEAGRGPLAGPVTAAAVILHPDRPIAGLDDSKKLPEKRRLELEPLIKQRALCWAIGSASVEEIDAINILQAAMLAMRRAVDNLSLKPAIALVDGNRDPGLDCPTRTVIGGDALHEEISAASILAKQERDRHMIDLASKFPQYGFENHKGYPTRAHIQALNEYGASMHHRTSFAPVQKVLFRPLS